MRNARRWIPAWIALLATACGGTPDGSTDAAPTADTAPAAVAVTFLDVGQGDAVLVQAPDGRAVLVDAGPGDPTDLLESLGVERLELVVASHPHADHIGGMEAVLSAFPVTSFMDNGKPHSTATYLRLMRTLRDRDDLRYLEAEPRTLTLGAVTLEILPLPPPEQVEHNDRSVGIVVRFGDFSVFLSGDSEERLLDHFLDERAVPDVTVLKAPHHGSRDGVTRRFLAAARPEVVVVSLGANDYGHPHAEALRAYGTVTREIYRTDLHGSVTVLGYADGGYTVRTRR